MGSVRAFVLAASLSVPVAAQSLEARVHDLRGLLRQASPRLALDATEPFVLPFATPIPNGEDAGDAPEPARAGWVATTLGRRADGEVLRDWLVAALHQQEDPGTLRCGDVVDGRVLVEAAPAVHDRLARRIADIEVAALRPVELWLVRLPGTALAAAGPLDDAAVAALLERFPPLGIWRRTARCGASVVLRAGRARAFLRDFEVEVAQDIEAGDPKVDVLFDGLLACVQVARAPGGGVVVTAALRRSETPDELPAIDTDFGSIQLPQTAVELHCARAFLPRDGAVLLGARGDHASTWLLRVRGIGGRRPDVVPLGGVEGTPWPSAPSRRSGLMPLPVPGMDFEVGVDAAPEVAALPEELEQAIADFESTEDVPVLRLGDALVVSRESAASARIATLARARADAAPLRLGWAVAFVDAAVAARLAAGDGVDAAAAGAGLTGALPLRVGELARSAVFVQRAYLRDYDVEIASGVSASNPIVDTWVDGVDVAVRARPAGDASYAVDGVIAVQRPATGSQRLPPRAYERGGLDAPRVDHVRVEIGAVVEGGVWHCADVAMMGAGAVAVFVRVDR